MAPGDCSASATPLQVQHLDQQHHDWTMHCHPNACSQKKKGVHTDLEVLQPLLGHVLCGNAIRELPYLPAKQSACQVTDQGSGAAASDGCPSMRCSYTPGSAHIPSCPSCAMPHLSPAQPSAALAAPARGPTTSAHRASLSCRKPWSKQWLRMMHGRVLVWAQHRIQGHQSSMT